MNTMLEMDYTKPLDFIDALSFGGEIVLLGMLAVFAVLGIIWALLTVFKMVFEKSATKEPRAVKPEPAPAPVVVQPTEDTEIVAVIAAAIAMAEAESGGDVKFRVVSFRRK